MRKFYRLNDNVHVPDRWHLGDPGDACALSRDFLEGVRFEEIETCPSLDLAQAGKPLRFSLTSFGVPVVIDLVGRAIQEIAGADVQRVPVSIPGCVGFEMLNAPRMLNCLDESRSEFLKWTSDDYRPDLAGEYRMVSKLKIDVRKVPRDANFFRIGGWRIALLVSEDVKKRMEDVGCEGALFQEVS